MAGKLHQPVTKSNSYCRCFLSESSATRSHSFGLMLIRAEVNGSPATLILDTGSNHTTISSRFVDVATPALRDTVSSEKGSGFPGTVDGLLGMDFLNEFEIAVVDSRQHKLILR